MSMALCISPLIILRIWHQLIIGKSIFRRNLMQPSFNQSRFSVAGYLSRRRSNCRSSMSIFQKFWILSTIDRIFWPIVIYCIYLAIGPWAICEVVDGEYGALFIWGVYISGSFFPGSLTYLYGFSQMIFCQFPLILIYAKCITKRYYQVIGMPTKNHRGSILRKFYRVTFYIIITIEIILSIYFGVYYGYIAFLLGPFRTWSVAMNILLYYFVQNVPEQLLKYVKTVFFDIL